MRILSFKDILEIGRRDALFEKFYREYRMDKLLEEVEDTLRAIKERERQMLLFEKICLKSLRETIVRPETLADALKKTNSKLKISHGGKEAPQIQLGDDTISRGFFQIYSGLGSP